MACWIFDTNVARIVVIRKLFPVILDILPSKDLFFLQIKLFNRRNTSLSLDSRFSYPMKLAERELSDKWSFVRRPSSLIWTQEEIPSAIDSISTRNCYLIIEGWAFVAIAGFSHAFKLLLWRFLKILASFAGEKWDVLWLLQSNESRRTSLVSYSFPLGE